MSFTEVLGNIASPIAAGIGLIQQNIQAKHERALNERSIQAQKDMAEYQYSKDLEQWNRANEYSSAKSQMQRLKEAGLNPRLVYGQNSAGAAGATATSPKYAAVRPEYNYSSPVDFSSVLGLYQSTQKHNAEMDILRSQTKIQQAEAEWRSSMLWNKSALLQSKGNREALRYGVESRTPEDKEDASQRWKWESGAGQMFSYQLTSQERKNELLQKDIEYYLANHLGSTAVALGKSIWGSAGKFANKMIGAKATKGVGKLKPFQIDSIKRQRLNRNAIDKLYKNWNTFY